MKNIKKTILIFVLSFISAGIGYAQVPAADSLALVKLYDSTGGDSWFNNSNWKSATNVDDWYGVTVSNGRVKIITLKSNNLTGNIPAQISDLTALERLDLVDNQIGGAIPASIGNLTNLYYLNLAWNNFSDASFPPEMSNLTNLLYLYLSSCNLSAFPSFVFNLTLLKTLALDYNQIPLIPAAIENLVNLESLLLASNQLNGNVPPQLSSLSKLHTLNLGQNGFSTLPTTITDMSWLVVLYMWGNALDEADMTNFGNLTNLNLVSFSNNAFHSIPTEITSLSNLESLYLASNQITNTGLGNLGDMTGLHSLSLGGNQLDAFPTEVLNFTDLEYLELAYNQISGEIPSRIADLSNLYFLYLNRNKFSGAVPTGIADLSNLIRIDLSENELDELPAFNVANDFQEIKIYDNYFTFEDIEPNLVFDSSVFTYAPQKEVGAGMDTVLAVGSSITLNVTVGGNNNVYQWYKNDTVFPNATSNSLVVHLNNPADFGAYKLRITNTHATELELWSKPFILNQENLLEQDSLALVALFNALDGSNWSKRTNWLNGPVSDWYGISVQNGRVEELLLNNNNLEGELPPEIGALDAVLYLKLNDNKISGSVPQEILNMSALVDLHLQNNQIEDIPDLHGLSPHLGTLMLEGNKLIFDNLKPNIDVPFSIFSYAPQDSLDIGDERTYGWGGNIFLQVPTPNPDNHYAWSKNGSPVGGDKNPLEIFSINYSNAGRYTCAVTNSKLPDLILHLRPVEVNVVGEPAVYYQTDVPTAPHTAQINFQVNPGGLPTTVEIHYGKTNAYGLVIPYNQGPLQGTQFLDLSMFLPDLEPNTGYQYKITAQNDSGTVFVDGLSFTTKSYPVSYQVNEHIALPERGKKSDYKSSDYRLFGLPGSSNTPLENIFTGTPDEDWIAYLDNGNASNYYQKFGTFDDFYFTQGRAFWVLSLHNVDIDRSLEAAHLNGFSEAEISLHEGWNLITNPFNQSVSWTSVVDANNLSTYQIYSFNGAFDTPEKLEPFQGYLFRPSPGMGVLRIPFPDGGVIKNAAKKVVTPTQRNGWELTLVLESEGFRDGTTRLGVRNDYTEQEITNYKKPRAMGDILNIWFEHPEWDEADPVYVTDFRSLDSDPHRWTFKTSLFPGKKAMLRVLNLEQIPEDQQVYLIQKTDGRFWNVRQTDAVSFIPVKKINEFEIVVGENTLIEDILKKMAPTEFSLEANFPNPFNPTTSIRYTLAAASRVNVTVFNALGQRVRTLVDSQQEAGNYSVTFNAANLASGIYYYRITTDAFTQTRKMILMR